MRRDDAEQLELFAQSLGRSDRVVLEVTGNAWEVARINEPRVARLKWRSSPRAQAGLFWCLLTRQEDYAYARPSVTKRRCAPRTGRRRPQGKAQPGIWATNEAMRQAERELARQGELAYRRTVADWEANRKGAGATPRHASRGRQSGKASVPNPAL